MSTQFFTRNGARDYGIALAGCNPATVQLTEDPDTRVTPAWAALMDKDDSEYEKKMEEAVADQIAYRFINVDGAEVRIVTDTFRDGFCVWGVLSNGAAVRF